MTHKHAICVGLIALGVAAATSAQAQYYGPPRIYAPPPAYYDGGLPPGEILMMVRAQGLTPLTQPARRGFRYVLLASDRMGGQLRVVVSAHNGRIIRAMPAYDPRFAYHPARPQAIVPVQPQYGAPPPMRHGAAPGPEVKDPPVARAPRRTPPAQAGAPNDQQLASVPATTESAPPRTVRTPLPRPRPASASSETAPAPSHETVAANPPADSPPAAQPQAATPPAAAQKAAPATTRKAPPAPRTETPLVPVAPLE